MASSSTKQTTPTARKMLSISARCSGRQTPLAATAVAPAPPTTGIFGMARKTGMVRPASFSHRARGPAAATESRIWSSRRTGWISFITAGRICGLTASTTMSAHWTASGLPPTVTAIEYVLAISSTRVGERSVARTCSGSATPAFKTPPINAPPMVPAPNTAMRFITGYSTEPGNATGRAATRRRRPGRGRSTGWRRAGRRRDSPYRARGRTRRRSGRRSTSPGTGR